VRKALGPIETAVLPKPGQHFDRGEVIVTVKSGPQQVRLLAPMRSRVVVSNEDLERNAAEIAASPYGRGWLCLLEPKDLAGDLAALRIGQLAVDWYHAEIERLRGAAGADRPAFPIEDWAAFERDFLRAAPDGKPAAPRHDEPPAGTPQAARS
jgi:glycine cleavage system H protein